MLDLHIHALLQVHTLIFHFFNGLFIVDYINQLPVYQAKCKLAQLGSQVDNLSTILYVKMKRPNTTIKPFLILNWFTVHAYLLKANVTQVFEWEKVNIINKNLLHRQSLLATF